MSNKQVESSKPTLSTDRPLMCAGIDVLTSQLAFRITCSSFLGLAAEQLVITMACLSKRANLLKHTDDGLRNLPEWSSTGARCHAQDTFVRQPIGAADLWLGVLEQQKPRPTKLSEGVGRGKCGTGIRATTTTNRSAWRSILSWPPVQLFFFKKELECWWLRRGANQTQILQILTSL